MADDVLITIKAKEEASEAFKRVNASAKELGDSLKTAGLVAAAGGAAATASLLAMGKAAVSEEINVNRLANTMMNAGTVYDDVKDSLEELIATTQRKTGVADDQQRDILNRLILVTKDYHKALELLPTVLDLAAAGEMDATTAATYLGKAYLELQEGAKEVTVRFGQASLQFKSLEDIQNRVRGSAEKLADPFNVASAAVGDLGEQIGSYLVPLIKDLTSVVADASEDIQAFTKEHETGAREATEWATAVSAGAMEAGALALIIPKATELLKKFGGSALKGVGYIAGLTVGLSMLNKGIMDLLEVKSATDATRDFMQILAEANQKVSEGTISLGEYNNILKNTIDAEQSLLDVGRSVHGLTAEQINRMTDWISKAQEQYEANVKLIQSQKDMADATARLNQAWVEANKKVSESIKEQNELLKEQNERFQDLMAELQYNQTEAAKLGLTMDDVYNYMWKLGYGVDEVREIFDKYGRDVNYTDEVLSKLGLDAYDVAIALGKLGSETLPDLTDKFNLAKDGARGLNDELNNLKATEQILSDEEFNAEHDRQQEALRQRAEYIEQLKASGAPVGEILKYSMTGLGYENRPEYWGEQNTQLFGAASLQDVRDLISKWVDEGVAQTMGMAQQAGYLPPGFDLEAYRRQLYDSMIAEYRRYLPGLANGGIITEPSLVYGLRSRRFISSLAEIGPELVVPTRGAGSPGTKVFEIPINIGDRRIAKVIAELIGDDLHVQRVS